MSAYAFASGDWAKSTMDRHRRVDIFRCPREDQAVTCSKATCCSTRAKEGLTYRFRRLTNFKQTELQIEH